MTETTQTQSEDIGSADDSLPSKLLPFLAPSALVRYATHVHAPIPESPPVDPYSWFYKARQRVSLPPVQFDSSCQASPSLLSEVGPHTAAHSFLSSNRSFVSKIFSEDQPICERASFPNLPTMSRYSLAPHPNRGEFRHFEGSRLVDEKFMFCCDLPECMKAYSNKSSLRKHQQTHTGERPFACDFPNCDKRFVLAAHLTRHRQTHSGFRPHACPFEGCGKRFLRQDDLKTHVRIHTGERPYVCDIPGCGKRFTQGCALTRHRRTRHMHLNNTTN
eukprot:c15187_g1_i1.p1 GENE.c15187_g1_i1~~c15187_g1_i1.p1  ORF type:complete len:275 (+),score=5.23 c15187_g1_i1:47-871(+)